MLEKDFDSAIIGTTPYAYLLGIELLLAGKKVVLISPPEDESKAFHEGTGPVTQFEFELMKHWGESRGITPLKNLEQYLSPLDVITSVGDKKLWLGQGPSSVLLELLRKCSFVFEKNEYFKTILNNDSKLQLTLQTFEQEFDIYLKELVKSVYNLGPQSKFNLAFMTNKAPLILKEIFECFRPFAPWKEEFDSSFSNFWQFKTFLYLLRTLYHKTSQITSSEFEIFHLLLQIFGKSYQLDSEKIIADLKLEYFKFGGRYKETAITDWQFSHFAPWALELGSFEGVIHPEQVLLMGHLLPDSELPAHSDRHYYYRLGFDSHFQKGQDFKNYHDLISLSNNWILCHSDPSLLGTEYPYLSIRKTFKEEGKIKGELWWKYQEGAKPEFFNAEINRQYSKLLASESFAHRDWPKLEIKSARKWPTWIEGKKGQVGQSLLYQPDVYGKGQKMGKINKIRYFGPEKREVLGPFSTLIDIKTYSAQFPVA